MVLYSNFKDIQILATEWIGDKAPYTATKEFQTVEPTDIVDVVFQCKDTETNSALSNAFITYATVAKDAVTLYAYGTKPEIPLDVRFIRRGVL